MLSSGSWGCNSSPSANSRSPRPGVGFCVFRVRHDGRMLLAYIDEIGETGAFVSRGHARFGTSPAFGYAGFVIPEHAARTFGASMQRGKASLYATQIAAASHPGRWEKKGADVFRPDTPTRFPAQLRVFSSLVREVRQHGGHLFYYANEKPLGTPRQTALDPDERETLAMRDTLNRLARHADRRDQHLMVVIDQVNEKTRSQRIPAMYSHILGRAADFPEMRRIIEPPMHVDSVLSANIQFADWVAACVSRAIDYQLLDDSAYRWVAEPRRLPTVRGSFTLESKLHLWQRSVSDLNHSEIFRTERAVHPTAAGQLLGHGLDPSVFRKIKAAAERAHTSPHA